MAEQQRYRQTRREKGRKKSVDRSSLGRCCTAEINRLQLDVKTGRHKHKHKHAVMLSYYSPVCSAPSPAAPHHSSPPDFTPAYFQLRFQHLPCALHHSSTFSPALWSVNQLSDSRHRRHRLSCRSRPKMVKSIFTVCLCKHGWTGDVQAPEPG